MSVSLIDHLRISWRILAKEVAAFGVVGAVCFVIDLGIFNLLIHQGVGNLKATVVSTIVATAVAYVGNRQWSFSHRARSSLRRETSFFFAINLVTLVISTAAMALFTYPLGYQDDKFVLNVVKLSTIGLGTVIRFWGYKRFVFLPHDPALEIHHEQPAESNHSGPNRSGQSRPDPQLVNEPAQADSHPGAA